MSDPTPDAQEDEDQDHDVPADLVELHEALEWADAVAEEDDR